MKIFTRQDRGKSSALHAFSLALISLAAGGNTVPAAEAAFKVLADSRVEEPLRAIAGDSMTRVNGWKFERESESGSTGTELFFDLVATIMRRGCKKPLMQPATPSLGRDRWRNGLWRLIRKRNASPRRFLQQNE